MKENKIIISVISIILIILVICLVFLLKGKNTKNNNDMSSIKYLYTYSCKKEEIKDVLKEDLDFDKVQDGNFNDLGKVTNNEEITLNYLDGSMTMNVVNTYKFTTKEGYENYGFISGDRVKYSSDDSKLTKVVSYSVEDIVFEDNTLDEESFKNIVTIYNTLGYSCELK